MAELVSGKRNPLRQENHTMSKTIRATIVVIALSIVPMAAIDATASAAPAGTHGRAESHGKITDGGTDWFKKPHQP